MAASSASSCGNAGQPDSSGSCERCRHAGAESSARRLARYVGKDPSFASLEALEAHLPGRGFLRLAHRRAVAPLTIHGAIQKPDGAWGFRYDPAIGGAFSGTLADIDLSLFWDAVTCPTLLLRGAHSDILPREVAEAMTQRGPKAKLVEFENVGHAPMLLNALEVGVVRVPAARIESETWRMKIRKLRTSIAALAAFSLHCSRHAANRRAESRGERRRVRGAHARRASLRRQTSLPRRAR